MKLSRDDWLEHGMTTLSSEGFGALKADLLARSLKVSRGSFYWHFRDLDGFHQALLDKWQVRATRQVIEEIEQAASGEQRLTLLVQRAWGADNRTERAVRAWATHSPEIAARLDAIDKQRIDYITSLLKSAGLKPNQARARAVFVVSAYLGHIVLGHGSFGSMSKKDLEDIVALLRSKAD